MANRLTQFAVENLQAGGNPRARVTQVAYEVLERLSVPPPPSPPAPASSVAQTAPLVPGYTQLTQAGALTILGRRLGDPNFIYWSQGELRLYIAEALRTWQALTSWYRARSTISSASSQQWYDLASVDSGAYGYHLADTDLLAVMLYHLLEAQLSGTTWAGTAQFSLALCQGAIQNRINKFLADSGAVVYRVLQPSGTLTGDGRVLIQPTFIDVRRMVWTPGSGASSVLWREDEWGMSAFLMNWRAPGTPQVYSQAAAPPANVQLAPPPASAGTLDMLLVPTGPHLNIPGGSTVLPVPDDFTWGIKWGALADLLSSDGVAQDEARAAYCEQRYQQCVQLAKIFPAVLQVSISGAPVWIGSVWELDAYSTGWQNAAAGTPGFAGLAGRNLLALSPPPSGSNAVTLDLVQNIPVPGTDTDYLQVPGDVLPVLIDYIIHLASFKMGGQEFAQTQLQMTNFLLTAGAYNNRLRQLATYNDALRSSALRDYDQNPRLDNPLLTAYSPSGAGNGK